MRKTIREIVIDIVSEVPDINKKQLYEALMKLGKPVNMTQVEGLLKEAKFANSTSVARFRDLAPDDHVYELNAEKKGVIKLGVISDTHFCSKDQKQAELEQTVDIMLNSGVTHFLCPGDLLEGWNVYRGQAQHVTQNTQDDQVNEAIQLLPQLPKGKKYYWISGNHDLIWLKQATGSDPLIMMDEIRDDFTYLGKYSAYVWVAPNVCVQLLHPAGGGGSSIGYPAQKYITNLPDHRRPHICLLGHWHRPLSFVHQGVMVEGCASFQGPNDLSIRHGWPNVVGGKIIDIELNKKGEIERYKKEDILFWEENLKMINRKKLI